MTQKPFLEIAISGSSMRPLLPPGSTAIVSTCDAAELKKGDIALFRSGKKLVVHRVVNFQRGQNDFMVAEKGDAGVWTRWRPAREVIGRVVAVRLSHGFLDLDHPWTKRVSVSVVTGIWSLKTPLIVRLLVMRILEFLLESVSLLNRGPKFGSPRP